MMRKYNWSRLNRLQIGRYAEYFVKMEFTLFGFEVYTAEVDDRGIDFVVRKDNRYYDVQVKSARGLNYIFFPKDKFSPRDNLLAAIVLFFDGEPPQLYLIPSKEWLKPNALLVSRDYEGKKSKPEWGLNLSKKNLPCYPGLHSIRLFRNYSVTPEKPYLELLSNGFDKILRSLETQKSIAFLKSLKKNPELMNLY
ncbi:hypothetical protein [Archaeoglobus veneficus]|uniref:DUF4365 domain-containing protein n=1 Tax=Archaeoglobus veneficus (strain DSM 11195 / SNP6) TaxID=693661 RepID=F2KQ39_ARCVS|nr:hypothetical protein [Archaeoglobus veneficus]AEA47642.1 hypothetical protein Arcve_1642 [Archaeoglobus veneficus SNP6]